MIDSRPKWRRLTVIAGLVVILILAMIAGSIFYSIKAAERRAQRFCDDVPVGSDISASVGRAMKEGILYGSDGGYDFYFPTLTGFDKAICSVSVDTAVRSPQSDGKCSTTNRTPAALSISE